MPKGNPEEYKSSPSQSRNTRGLKQAGLAAPEVESTMNQNLLLDFIRNLLQPAPRPQGMMGNPQQQQLQMLAAATGRDPFTGLPLGDNPYF